MEAAMDMKALKVGRRVIIESYFDGRREATVKEVTEDYVRVRVENWGDVKPYGVDFKYDGSVDALLGWGSDVSRPGQYVGGELKIVQIL
jgi:hypothetical protein